MSVEAVTLRVCARPRPAPILADSGRGGGTAADGGGAGPHGHVPARRRGRDRVPRAPARARPGPGPVAAKPARRQRRRQWPLVILAGAGLPLTYSSQDLVDSQAKAGRKGRSCTRRRAKRRSCCTAVIASKCSRDRQASTQSLVPIAVRPAPVPLRGLRTVAAKRGFRPRPGLEGAERLGPLYSAQENSGLYLVLLTDNCTGRRDRTRRER